MEFTAQQIADFLHGEVVGDATVKLNNVSKIEEGKPNTLTFLSNLKYAHYIYDTNASAVLVNKSFIPEKEIKATLIKVDDAYACIAMLLNMVSQARPKKKGIEENVHIAKGVEIPETHYIGAFAYIGENVKLGNNISIYPQVYIGDNVVIGENVTLYDCNADMHLSTHARLRSNTTVAGLT